MKSIRDCHISGNLVRNPVSIKTKSGKDLAYFTLACNYKAGGEDKVTYVELEAWEKMARYCSSYMKKGNFISARASLKQERVEKNGSFETKTRFSAYELNNISMQNKMIEDSSPELKKVV